MEGDMASKRLYVELMAHLIDREIAKFRRGERAALVSFSNVAKLAGNAIDELTAAQAPSSPSAAALQHVASGRTFVPAYAMINRAEERQSRSKQTGTPEASPLKDLTPPRERRGCVPAEGQAEQDHRARARNQREHRQSFCPADTHEPTCFEAHQGRCARA
jgi:hypothetical protein